MALSGTLTITPTLLAFAGSKCLLSWDSTGADRVFITGLGYRQPVGFEYVYPTVATTYVATFTNYAASVVATVSVTTGDDPAVNSTANDAAALSIRIVRNVNAGQSVVNTYRPVGDGSPSYIISSRQDQQLNISLLSDDGLGVL